MTSSLALLFCLVAATSALPRPQFSQAVPTLTSRTQQFDDAGQFTLSFSQSNGHTQQEQGILKPTPQGDDYVLVKQGNFGYISPEGIPVQITYTADEDGFHPTGNVIPVAPAPVATTF